MPTATCHCGAVTIAMDERPTTVTECTCSVCRRYGARWAYCTAQTARVKAEPGATRAYVWGDKLIEFHHCTTCGCLTHYEGVEKKEDGRVAVNARMLPPADVEGVRVRLFDGADTWKYLNE